MISQGDVEAFTGDAVRARRLALGLRQRDVAAATGISPPYLALIESGQRVPAEKVRSRLVEVLGLSPEEPSEPSLASQCASLLALPFAVGGSCEAPATFAAAYPGWARLLVMLAGEWREDRARVEALSDPFRHDSHLSAGLHELLTAAASLSSTASILDDEALDANWRRRFLRNMREDNERLLAAVNALSGWLEGEAQPAGGNDLRDWLERHGDLASLLQTDWPALLACDPPAPGSSARMLSTFLFRLERDAELLERVPDDADPLDIAAETGLDPCVVLRRIAVLRRAGLVTADASGHAVSFGLPPGFPVPPPSEGCSTLPLHHAVPGRPDRAVCGVGAGGTRFLCTAAATERSVGGIPVLHRVMLVEPANAPAERMIGPGCPFCPAQDCPARRSDERAKAR